MNTEIEENLKRFLNRFFAKKRNGALLLFSKRLRLCYHMFNSEELNYETLCMINRTIEKSLLYRVPFILQNALEDIRICFKQIGKRKVIDQRHEVTQDYFSVASIVKNEGANLKEFIEFYLMQGVDCIYLFDNESSDKTWEVVSQYVASGKLVYIFFPGKKVQFSAYRFATRYCKKFTRWLAFLDADEFLFSPDCKLPVAMKQFEQYPGVGVNWVLFGPSGHEERPDGLVIENYLETFADADHPYNKRIKSIVDPKRVESCTSPHFCLYKGGDFAVDTQANEIDGSACYLTGSGLAFTNSHCRDVLRINHYITKSKAELREKCKRGYPDGNQNPNYKISLDRFAVPLVKDRTILQFVSELKEKAEQNG